MSQWTHYAEKDPEWEARWPTLLANRPEKMIATPEAIAAQRESDLKTFKAQLETAEYPSASYFRCFSFDSLVHVCAVRLVLSLLVEEGYDVIDRNIPVADGTVEVEARFYIPNGTDSNQTFPVLLDFHGMPLLLIPSLPS